MNTTFEQLQRAPVFWEDAAAEAVDAIVTCPAKHPGLSSVEIRQEFNAAEKEFLRLPGARYEIANHWARVGHAAITYSSNSGWGTLNRETLVNTLVRKQRDYGKNNILRYGLQGVFIRCHDKVARLENLVGASMSPMNEPVSDTLLDIAGYAAIAIMLEMHTFELPMTPSDMQSV